MDIQFPPFLQKGDKVVIVSPSSKIDKQFLKGAKKRKMCIRDSTYPLATFLDTDVCIDISYHSQLFADSDRIEISQNNR